MTKPRPMSSETCWISGKLKRFVVTAFMRLHYMADAADRMIANCAFGTG